MFSLFRAVLDRLKALLATSAALELEADALARHAQRKAELLHLAEQYESEKLHSVAQELRQHAETLDLQLPLAGILNTLAWWPSTEGPPALPAATGEQVQPAIQQVSGRRKPR